MKKEAPSEELNKKVLIYLILSGTKLHPTHHVFRRKFQGAQQNTGTPSHPYLLPIQNPIGNGMGPAYGAQYSH